MMQATMTMPSVMNNPELWNAVVSRDASRDGSFVFAVRSTGIYCRPSCPARRPKREQVSFFQIPEAAEQAGFRACRRCHPRRARVSDHHLQRTFKDVMGITPRQYAEARRLKQFKMNVKSGASVTEALYTAGYGSSRGLYEQSSSRLGMTPATYGRGGKGARIIFTITGCAFGRLMVAATERGVCSVALGNSDSELMAALFAEYPSASIDSKDTLVSPALNLHLNKVLEYLE